MSFYLLKHIIEKRAHRRFGYGRSYTTNAIFTSTDSSAKGTFISKASGIIAGMATIELTILFGTDVMIKSQKRWKSCSN